MNSKIFGETGEDNEWCFVCPICGSEYSHHEREPVEVWQRAEDEMKPGFAILPNGDGLRIISGNDNPSRRRAGLRINVQCEDCGSKYFLGIAQHKGQTLISLELAVGT